jgi:cysteine-rich repeat protein
MRYLRAILISGFTLFAAGSAFAVETCGDGVLDGATESCDDGGNEPNDGCDEDCQVECTEVGEKATEHTCLHGSNGPFADRVANSDGETVTTDVSPSHTYYTVVLPGESGDNLSRVQFVPSTSSTYAIYMKEAYPLTLLDEKGSEVEVFLEHGISSCAIRDSLTWVRVFRMLDAGKVYTVELGPYGGTTMSLAFEALGFVGPLYRDSDRDGYAARGQEVARTWCAPPPGYSSEQGGDCDDTDPLTFPGATELCDGKNNDCDGRTDQEESGMCAAEARGSLCESFGGTTRCGCQSDEDCPSGSTCGAQGECQGPTPGSGGEGGAPANEPAGGTSSGGEAAAGSATEASAEWVRAASHRVAGAAAA